MLGTSRRGRVFSPFSLPCPHGRSNCLGRKKGTGKRKRRRGKGEGGREGDPLGHPTREPERGGVEI